MKHVPQLDGIRAIAILSVVACHVWLTLDYPTLHRVMSAGWAGVDLFFVLSGFLITGVLLDARSDSRYFRNFYGRRILRIWPLYYLVLAFILFAWPSHNLDLVRENWALYVFWLANFVPPDTVPLAAAVMWSLSVEEQFYIVWPFVARYCTESALLKVCVAILIATPIIRLILSPDTDMKMLRNMTVCRMDTLAAGALICLIHRGGMFSADTLRRAGWLLTTLAGCAWLVTTALALNETHRLYGDTLHYSVILAGSCGVLLLALYSEAAARVLRSSPLVAIGRVSFGMYLFHAFALIAVSWVIERARIPWSIANSLALLVSVSALTFGVAWLSFNLFERPILGLKSYFAPVPQRRMVSA